MDLDSAPRFDSADYLKTPEDIGLYMQAVLEDGDPALFLHALGVAARAHGMARVAETADLGRESLYKALSAEGNPRFETVVRVLRALGMRLSVEAIPGDPAGESAPA